VSILLPLMVAAGATLVAQDPSPTRPRTLIAGVRILDAEAGSYVPPSFVLIEGNRIRSVGRERPGSVLEDTQTIDGQGLTLVPGLVDTHAQVSPTDDLDADYFALMSLAHGVTAVRGINVRTPWGVSQRKRMSTGSAGPRLFISGRGIDQAARPDLWLFDASSVAAAADEAKRQAAAGVDWIAGYDHVTAEMYRAMAAAVKGTSARIAARPGAASLSELAAAGVHSVETLDYPFAGAGSSDPASGPAEARWPAAPARDVTALVRALVKANVTLVPLLAQSLVRAFPDDVAADPELAKLPAARRDGIVAAAKAMRRPDVDVHRKDWTARGRFLKQFVAAGGRIATGTGFESAGYPVPGAGLHTELAALVRAGLTPVDALRASTVAGAALLGATDRTGAVKPGMEADLILVEGDPLSSVGDLAKIRYVIRAGVVLEPKDLLARALRLAQQKTEYRRQNTEGVESR
jgi:hypothetical protein